MKLDNFFAELKRRNVYKVAVAYAIVAYRKRSPRTLEVLCSQFATE